MLAMGKSRVADSMVATKTDGIPCGKCMSIHIFIENQMLTMLLPGTIKNITFALLAL